MMLLAVVLLASTQGYGPVAPTQGYVPVDFDTVVSTLLRQEMATGGAALARHLRPVLAGRGAVWAQRRRDALDSVSQPIAEAIALAHCPSLLLRCIEVSGG